MPLLIAIGRAVISAAALEAVLRLEAARLLLAEHRADDAAAGAPLSRELSRLDGLTAPGLLKRLTRLDLPGDLDRAVRDVLGRRDDMVHRAFLDTELTGAVTKQESVDAVVKRIDRLALDCAELAVELDAYAVSTLLGLTGESLAQLVHPAGEQDPSARIDLFESKQLEAVRALAAVATMVEGLPLGEVVGTEPACRRSS